MLASAFGAKWNIVGFIVGASHEKLQVYHQWLSHLFLILSMLHTFPFVVQGMREVRCDTLPSLEPEPSRLSRLTADYRGPPLTRPNVDGKNPRGLSQIAYAWQVDHKVVRPFHFRPYPRPHPAPSVDHQPFRLRCSTTGLARPPLFASPGSAGARSAVSVNARTSSSSCCTSLPPSFSPGPFTSTATRCARRFVVVPAERALTSDFTVTSCSARGIGSGRRPSST
jgi:hypothetical protein